MNVTMLVFAGILLAMCAVGYLLLNGQIYEWHMCHVVRRLAKECDAESLSEQIQGEYRCFSVIYGDLGWDIWIDMPDISTNNLPAWPPFVVRINKLLWHTSRSYYNGTTMSKDEWYDYARNRANYLTHIVERLLMAQEVPTELHN